MSQSDNTSAADDHPHSSKSEDMSMEAVKTLVVETRAALDVLTEMVCLLYADGDKNEYHETIRALKHWQAQSEEQVLKSLKEKHPRASSSATQKNHEVRS